MYQHRHQFVENNLILKMGPVDKRKVCVNSTAYIWILNITLLHCFSIFKKRRHLLVLYTILPARLCGVFQFELATDQWSHFPLLFTAVKWEVKGNSLLYCAKCHWPRSPLCWWSNEMFAFLCRVCSPDGDSCFSLKDHTCTTWILSTGSWRGRFLGP